MGNGVRYEMRGYKCEVCGEISVNGRAVCQYCNCSLESRPQVPRGPAVAYAEAALRENLNLKGLTIDGFALEIGASPATVYRAMESLGLQRVSLRREQHVE